MRKTITNYDLCDDYGVWLVVPRSKGRWRTEAEAQAAADARNIEAGIADEFGVLLDCVPDSELWLFVKHLAHAECTCIKTELELKDVASYRREQQSQ